MPLGEFETVSPFGKLATAEKVAHRVVTTRAAILFPGINPRERESLCPHRHLDVNVQSGMIS